MNYNEMELTFRYSTTNFKGANTLKEILKYKRRVGEWCGFLRCYKLGKSYFIEQWEYKDRMKSAEVRVVTIE